MPRWSNSQKRCGQGRNSFQHPPRHRHSQQRRQPRQVQEQQCRDPSKSLLMKCVNGHGSNGCCFALVWALTCRCYKTTHRMKILMSTACLSKNLEYQANLSKRLMKRALIDHRWSCLSFQSQEVLSSRRHLIAHCHPDMYDHPFR
jgi:hypothetical protein